MKLQEFDIVNIIVAIQERKVSFLKYSFNLG